MTYGEHSKGDKIIPIVCGLILVAFFACLPNMIAEQNHFEEQQWQSQGCEMYDDYKPANVPAKCSTYFIDHYQAQQTRLQPPEARRN